MKILLACHQFFPRFYTGTEVLTLETAQELRRRGHEVAILATEPILPGDSAPEQVEVIQENYDGFTVWKLKIPESIDQFQRLDRESNDYILTDIFDNILQKYNPDIVQIFHLMRLTLSFVHSVKKRGLPAYLVVTDFWLLCPTYQLIRHDESLCNGPTPNGCTSCLIDAYAKGMPYVPNKFKLARKWPHIASVFNSTVEKCRTVLAERPLRHRELFEMLDGIIWSNPFIKKIFENNGMVSTNDKILPFPIPRTSVELTKIPLANTDGPLNVAFIGTLRHSKGPHILIKAAKYLSNPKHFQFFIWGAAERESYGIELKELASDLVNVEFCGTFPQNHFDKVLEKVHIVVVPSIWYENTPLTALSVLAAKRVLIVSDLGGLSSLIENNVTGFTFPPNNPEELSKIINRIYEDKSMMKRISDNVPTPNFIEDYVEKLVKEVWRMERLGGIK